MSLLSYASLSHRRGAFRSADANVLLDSQTAAGSATLSFASGITSKYREYIFKFYNCNPATDDVDFSFQVNAAGGSGYNETITSTSFDARDDEGNSVNSSQYVASDDQGQGTAFQILQGDVGNEADESCSGWLHLFDPGSTTYVTHFIAESMANTYNVTAVHQFTAGYINTTSAIDEVQFKFSSGNFDGLIKLWGVK
jgi:hypothetical protein